MHEFSKGSLAARAPFVREGLAGLFFGGFVAAAGGCPGPAPMAVGGAGGDTSTSSTSTSSTTTPSTSTTTSTTTTETNTTSTTTTTTCDETQCQPQGQCDMCDPVKCAVVPRDQGAACTQNGGKFCDGAGACVECLDDTDCPAATSNPCSGNVYVGKQGCEPTKHVCKPVKDDCTAKKLVCTATGCSSCGPTTPCPLGASTCSTSRCVDATHLCEAPVGAPCQSTTGTTSGTCGLKDTCSDGKYVFVTSKPIAGNFAAAVTLDYICETLARSKGFTGQWQSWTSDVLSPLTRFTGKSFGAPYRRLDGVIVAADWDGLVSGGLQNPINIDENGGTIAAEDVWTGTNADGTAASATCGGWTGPVGGVGVVGSTGATSAEWTSRAKVACTTKARLYCFQQ